MNLDRWFAERKDGKKEHALGRGLTLTMMTCKRYCLERGLFLMFIIK